MQLKRIAASTAAIACLGLAAFVYTSHPARGSDHQDSPAVVAQPGADITDLYVFPSPADPKRVELVMDVIPLIPAGMSGKYSLDPGVLYQFKFAHGPFGTTAPADLAFQLMATGTGSSQTVTLYGQRGNNVANPATLGTNLGTFPFNQPNGTWLNHGIEAFAGPRADPFFFDLFQFFKILPDRNYSNPRTDDHLGTSKPTFNGYPAGSTSGPGAGNYACSTAPSTNALTQINGGFNVVSIVLSVPISLFQLNGQSSIVHAWATASVAQQNARTSRGGATYSQVELLSRPAVKELFEEFDHHAITNANEPYADPQIKYAISYFMQHVAGRSAAINNVISSVLYPNELAFDVSQPGPAAYLGVETGGATGSKFGGRALTDDVITTSLGVVFGNTVPALGLAPDDGKENDCLTNEHVTSGQGGTQTQARFPFVTTPH
jgi:hypothetical protein